jgi:hypothetical protein
MDRAKLARHLIIALALSLTFLPAPALAARAEAQSQEASNAKVAQLLKDSGYAYRT